MRGYRPRGRYKFEGVEVGCIGSTCEWGDTQNGDPNDPTLVGSDLVRVHELDDGTFAVYWELVRNTISGDKRAICDDLDQAVLFATMVGSRVRWSDSKTKEGMDNE